MDGSGNNSSLPWGISNAKLQPSSLGQITDSKLATFAAGQQKKSRFQKAREGTRCSSRLCSNSFFAIFDNLEADGEDSSVTIQMTHQIFY